MICWSCQKKVEPDVFCGSCRAILPSEGAPDHFQVLGLPRVFGIDLAAAEARYKELARAVHPDKFVRADPQARRAAMQRTVQVNDAWRTLRDPWKRAEYLLSLRGIETGGEEGLVVHGADGSRERVPVDQGLLMEMLEKREALAEARLADDPTTVAALESEMRERLDRALTDVAAGLDGGAPAPAIARTLVAGRYFRRFLEDLENNDAHAGDAAAAGAV